MAYVYRHIRLDKNVPFYIGISEKDIYRATITSCRNPIWKAIAKKTEYDVEILLDGLSWEEACEKEKEFIKLYGRIDLKTGTLANLTDGGEGTLGRKYAPTKEHRKNLSKSAIGKKMSNEARIKMSRKKKVPILQYDLDGNFIREWDGISDAAKALGGYSANIMRCCQKEFKYAYGYVWRYKDKTN